MKTLATILVRANETLTAVRKGERMKCSLDDGQAQRLIVDQAEFSRIKRDMVDEMLRNGDGPLDAVMGADIEMECAYIPEPELDPVQLRVLDLVRKIVEETRL